MTTNTKQAAENALWHALEERRDDLRDLKLWSGRTAQQHEKFYDAHAAERLIDQLVAVLKRRATQTGGDPVQLAAMAGMVKHGLLWEQVAIREEVAPYLCTLRLSSAVLGSMVGLLDSWVVSGRGRGEG